MTYDPYRYDHYRYDPYRYGSNSNEPPRDLETVTGSTILFGGLLFAAIGAFIYLFAGPSDQTSRQYDLRPPITQSEAAPAPERSSANMPPATPSKVNSVE